MNGKRGSKYSEREKALWGFFLLFSPLVPKQFHVCDSDSVAGAYTLGGGNLKDIPTSELCRGCSPAAVPFPDVLLAPFQLHSGS